MCSFNTDAKYAVLSSRVPTQQWNGDKLRFLLHLLLYDINGEKQHLFMPRVTDRILPDESTQSNVIVIGNAVENF